MPLVWSKISEKKNCVMDCIAPQGRSQSLNQTFTSWWQAVWCLLEYDVEIERAIAAQPWTAHRGPFINMIQLILGHG